MSGSQRNGFSSLLSLHGRALREVLKNNKITLRELAVNLDVTERTAWSIISELEAAGFVTHAKVGRGNVYTVGLDRTSRVALQDLS